MPEQLLMMGNEAVALSAYHSGVAFASAYPGTPSTEDDTRDMKRFAAQVKALVSLKEPRTLEREAGKAKRILDRRE